MINESGLEPAGVAVLVKPYEIADTYKGIIEIPDAIKGRDQMVEQRAIVIAVGSSAWHDEREPRAKPGDKVLITKFAGYMAVGPYDGKSYRLVNDRDIFARITKEKEE